MAKGANVDKLAAEFADELDSLGVRVANLEKKSDNVKITGQVRASYKDLSGDVDGDGAALRTRLWVTGEVNEDWTYTGMFQNTQDLSNDEGDEDVVLNRAYLNGRLGGLDVQAGRWDEVLFTGNVLDSYLDGVKVSYGDKVKVFGLAAKGASHQDDNVDYLFDSEDRLYVVGVEADMGDEQRAEAGLPPNAQKVAEEAAVEGPDGEHEQEHHGHAGDDVRVGQGDVVYRQEYAPGPAAHGVEADGGGGAQDGGDEGGQHRQDDGGAQGPQQPGVVEELPVPLQGEAAPDPVALGGVEGEDDEQYDGGVQEEIHQEGKDPGGNAMLFHRTAFMYMYLMVKTITSPCRN